jgi:hypothetical protein
MPVDRYSLPGILSPRFGEAVGLLGQAAFLLFSAG